MSYSFPDSFRCASFALLALLLTSCSGSSSHSGGGPPPPIALAFLSSSASVAEGNSIAIPVELQLAGGIPLATAVTVNVSATGGTASGGTDYTFSNASLSFPAGSGTGTQRMATLNAVGDVQIEDTESILLSFTAITGGAGLGTIVSETISLIDVSAGGGQIQIEVFGGAIVSGSSADLGAQPASAGPGGVTTLILRNIGGNSLTCALPVLVAGNDREFIVEFGSASPLPAPLPAGPPPASPLIDLADDPVEGVLLIVDDVALAAVADLPRLTIEGVALPGGLFADLDLERVSSPWTSDAVIAIDGAFAPFDESWIEDVSFWRGKLIGDPASRVFLTLSPRSSLGWIRCDSIPGGIAYLLPEDMNPAESGGVDARLVLADQMTSTGKELPGAYCEAPFVPAAGLAEADPMPFPAALPPAGAFAQGQARLAIETDYQFSGDRDRLSVLPEIRQLDRREYLRHPDDRRDQRDVSQ